MKILSSAQSIRDCSFYREPLEVSDLIKNEPCDFAFLLFFAKLCITKVVGACECRARVRKNLLMTISQFFYLKKP